MASQTIAPAWPIGFRCASASAGIKKPGVRDLALLVTDRPATAAAVFTRNLIAAAPIQVSREHLFTARSSFRALLVNSGCANAATGPEGLARAQRSAALLANALGVRPGETLINSTGVIGVLLPIDRIESAMAGLVSSLAGGSCEPFARAIMTTDTRPKWSTRTIRFTAEGRDCICTVTGVTKGAGMIHPNMATMIGVIATDAAVAATDLDSLLRDAVEGSFHRISIDGDTSTNDSVFAIASGEVGAVPLDRLRRAFAEVAGDLAQLIVRDGEGFERGIAVLVSGARTNDEALTVAKTVASSLLVRTAITGGDPNWGRILAAAGRAGVPFDPAQIRVSAGGITLFAGGSPANADIGAVRAAFAADTVDIAIDLGMGSAHDHFWSCGLTTRYVEINADYTT